MENKTHNSFRVRQQGNRQIVDFRATWLGAISRVLACLFMTVWLSGWSVGCTFLVHELITDFSWFMLLFSLPFLVGWFAGASFLLASLFGKQRLILNKDQLEFVFLVLVPVKRKRISYQEIISIELTSTDRFSAIKIDSTGEPVTFGAGYNLQVLGELREYLLDEIPIANGEGKSGLADDPARIQRKTDKPESSRWHLKAGISQNGTEFVNRGQLDLGGTLVFGGITLFCNGIVGVFVVKIIQAWRGLGDEPASIFETLFLVPFALVGIALFLFLLLLVMEPFRKTVFRFSAREISRQFGYFGIAWTKTWPVMLAVTMKVKLETDFEDVPEMRDGRDYLLRFAQENKKLTEIDALTMAEAYWIATEIENRQPLYTLSNGDKSGVIQALGQQKQ